MLRPLLLVLIFSTLSTSSSAQEIIFSEDFESGELNSTVWTAQPGEAGGVVNVVDRLPDVPAIPRSGNYALALGRAENGSSRDAPVNRADLRLNLAEHDQVTLRFYIRDEADDADDEDAIFLSDDGGGSFERVLRLQPREWGDGVYAAISIDIAAAARVLGLELTDQFVIRFQQRARKSFAGRTTSGRDGFFIDDVVVLGAPTYASPPFSDGFEDEMLGPSWRMADPYNSGETALEAEAQWGLVETVSRLEDVPLIPRTGNRALALGRPIGGGKGVTTNAADLHLDLEGREQVALRFYLRDEADDSDEYDGVFLSDDGGETFQRALDLDPRERPDGEYGEEVALDLVQAAQNLGLELTDRFVVRFQQRGTRDFAGNTTSGRDGFFIDDVEVMAPLSPMEEVQARVAEKLRQWERRGEFEKTEDYEARMSSDRSAVEDSLTQAALAEVGEERIDWSTASASYDADAEAFTVKVDGLEPFELAVPIDKAEAFSDSIDQVQFQNPVYALGEEDLKVEHVEVINTATGGTYVHDSGR